MKPLRAPIDDVDRRLILATQQGLPLTARPYHAVAERIGVTPDEVMARLARMRALGIVRRIALVPNHYALGYRANGMAVWDVDDSRVDALGARVAALTFVSHCYGRVRRPPRWPYNLFVMVHGVSRDEVREKVAEVSTLLGDSARAHEVLFSTRILKKSGLRLQAQPAVAKSQERATR